MCGFVGCFGASKDLKDKVLLAGQFLRHRGDKKSKPKLYYDDNFSAAFSRLAIKDLNESSKQPYKKDGYNFVLCFNGEIYNYKELKDILIKKSYIFQSDSDTELVYLAFDYWGLSCFEKFRGMFAICVFDIEKKRMFLARDALGIKTLYYTIKEQNVYFASEIKAFKPFISFSPNYDNLFEFLKFGTNLGKSTIFKGIYQLKPAQILSIDVNLDIKTSKFFSLVDTFGDDEDIDFSQIKDLLDESVRLHCDCDVKYGCQLSGGLDSSLITVLAHKYSKDMETFSVRFTNKDLDETKFQKLLTDELQIQSNFIVYDNFFNIDKLNQAIYFEDFPLHHPNILASNEINMLAECKANKVLLSGDGADEVFCGYNWHLREFQMSELDEAINKLSYCPFENLKNSVNLHQKELNPEILSDISKIPNNQVMVYLGQRIYLDKWLRRQDRSGMQNSLEIRVPYLDIVLLKALNKYSIKAKTNNFRNAKFILKRVAEPYINNKIIYQKKIGFPMPIKEYFASKKAEIFWEFLRSKKAKERGFYNFAYIENLIKNHKENLQDNSRSLWAILNLELWFRIFIDKQADIKF
ncbi:asparagine synthase (glutamine-hydrolyzing) [Campylobacter sp.]|uniref:asparagine synthase (glutamine-hydrolyzing) n=2 Tax=Campylobacter sp. TaxID=205 RepID=UPI002AA7EEE2|nr:asparagine synthase (glutamine-hydrolyzing) [Campylobacter sp.]MCI6565052.1 asparagine synthase (glutamine-hydrolyzing) [Campylobacter sp.]